MTAGDHPAFAELLALLGETFQEPISEARCAAYFDALRDLPLAAVQAAVREALRDCRFFPRPVELRERAGYVPVSPAWVNERLSEGIGGKPVSDFVRLFVRRLGGWRGVEDRLPVARLALVEKLYPGVLAAARAGGIEIPTEAQASRPLALPPPRDRSLFDEPSRDLDRSQAALPERARDTTPYLFGTTRRTRP
jgi:hypothetical protein